MPVNVQGLMCQRFQSVLEYFQFLEDLKQHKIMPTQLS